QRRRLRPGNRYAFGEGERGLTNTKRPRGSFGVFQVSGFRFLRARNFEPGTWNQPYKPTCWAANPTA
ncbi:MAG: hypothetical protein KTR29_05585, partial [Rhodothermaceae bacterium]|nr:hypothetical protein [Rhodothermaceae bacterium]